MSKMVKIASRLPTALRIQEPDPNPEKPGLSGPLRTAVINGANSPGTTGEGISEIDADLWKAWSGSDAFKAYEGQLRVMKDGEDTDGTLYGFEPGLEAVTKDRGNTRLNKEGSTTEEAPPVPATEMKTGGDAVSDGVPVQGGLEAATVEPKKPRGRSSSAS